MIILVIRIKFRIMKNTSLNPLFMYLYLIRFCLLNPQQITVRINLHTCPNNANCVTKRFRFRFSHRTSCTVAIEIIQPPSGKFCVFVSEKKDTISKHQSYFSFLQSNNLFSELFRQFLRLGQCS